MKHAVFCNKSFLFLIYIFIEKKKKRVVPRGLVVESPNYSPSMDGTQYRSTHATGKQLGRKLPAIHFLAHHGEEGGRDHIKPILRDREEM